MNRNFRIAIVVSALLLAAGIEFYASETGKAAVLAGAALPAPGNATTNIQDKATGAHMKKSLGAKTLATVPVWVVGSYDAAGKPNVMTAAWVGICCSKPPCITVSLRKATSTYGNIMARQAFTVSIPSDASMKEADYFGLVSGRDADKFAVSGLTPVKSELVDAPYVAEFPLVIECKLAHSYDIGLHTMFVGEIMDVKADPAVLGENGSVDARKARPFFFDTDSRRYFKLGEPAGKAFEAGKTVGK